MEKKGGIMNKKQLKKMVDWMYSKDNPNYKYNKKNYGSKKETLNWLKIQRGNNENNFIW